MISIEGVLAPPVLTLHLPMAADKAVKLLETADELWPDAWVYPGDSDIELNVIPRESEV